MLCALYLFGIQYRQRDCEWGGTITRVGRQVSPWITSDCWINTPTRAGKTETTRNTKKHHHARVEDRGQVSLLVAALFWRLHCRRRPLANDVRWRVEHIHAFDQAGESAVLVAPHDDYAIRSRLWHLLVVLRHGFFLAKRPVSKGFVAQIA